MGEGRKGAFYNQIISAAFICRYVNASGSSADGTKSIMLVLKREKLTFSGLTWIPEQSLQTQASGRCVAKAHSALQGERAGLSTWEPDTHCLPIIPAHSFKEAGVAITVGLLGPQDVGGLEGLAVLLLGGLDVILWKAEEGAVRNQGRRGPTAPAPPLTLAVLWTSSGQGSHNWRIGARAPDLATPRRRQLLCK